MGGSAGRFDLGFHGGRAGSPQFSMNSSQWNDRRASDQRGGANCVSGPSCQGGVSTSETWFSVIPPPLDLDVVEAEPRVSGAPR